MKRKRNNRISILVPCKLASRDIVGALVRHICTRLEECGEPEEFGYQVISAFNEAFNNLTSHGGEGITERDILVIVEVTEGQLIIELQDDGDTFNLSEEMPALDPLSESGMGLYIMRSFMNELDYKPSSEGRANALRMTRDLKHARPDESQCS